MTQLRRARLVKKISQVELARQLGITHGAVSLAEKDGIKTIKTAIRYAKALKCDPLFLLEDVGLTNS